MLRHTYIVFAFALVMLVENSSSMGVSKETQKLLLKVADGQTKTNDDCNLKAAVQPNNDLIETQIGKPKTGVQFQCSVSDEDRSPTSVHALRPEDIDVVGGIGDSYTAAFGAGANFLGPKAFLEHRGLSFSIGGDETLETHVSLPNILKKYNPDVYGFSVGIGKNVDTSKLNVAVTGATSEYLSGMVDELIGRLEDDPLVNMEEDWKLITVFIGGNDIFDACLEPRFTPDKFKELLTTSFSTLKAMIPHALVNVLPTPDLTEMKKLTGVVCDVVHMSMCPCLYAGEKYMENIKNLSKEYGHMIEELASSGDFDTEDFALVYQPSSNSAYVPVGEDGSVDSRHFAPDCLHLSRLGHATTAYYLWSNMLEPVNAKLTKWAPTMEEYLPCPSSPYIYTNRNSVPGSVSSNQHSSNTNSDSKLLGGGVITAIVFLIGSLVVIIGYVIYRQMHKSRWSYESL